ncbi:hypothetical protein [uncultured Winogradskyella sp.]|nr:hypothetical protein [uncultured Winogradskyella sp.]
MVSLLIAFKNTKDTSKTYTLDVSKTIKTTTNQQLNIQLTF